MDRDAISAATHEGLAFANPLPEAAIDAAITALELPAGARVLDVGCGTGELLARRRSKGCASSPPQARRPLVGEGFWRRPPSAGYLAALGGATVDELPDHDGLLAGAVAAGWEVVQEAVAP